MKKKIVLVVTELLIAIAANVLFIRFSDNSSTLKFVMNIIVLGLLDMNFIDDLFEELGFYGK